MYIHYGGVVNVNPECELLLVAEVVYFDFSEFLHQDPGRKKRATDKRVNVDRVEVAGTYLSLCTSGRHSEKRLVSSVVFVISMKFLYGPISLMLAPSSGNIS